MPSQDLKAYGHYRWIVADPRLLGGALAVRGTRLSAAQVLECLSSGMTVDDIDNAFGIRFPRESVAEVLKVAAEILAGAHVAA